MNTVKITAASFALLAALAAAGCGGGGSDQVSQASPTPVAPGPPPPTATPTPESFNKWASGLIATVSDGNGAPVDMDTLTFAFDADSNAYDPLFVGHE